MVEYDIYDLKLVDKDTKELQIREPAKEGSIERATVLRSILQNPSLVLTLSVFNLFSLVLVRWSMLGVCLRLWEI